MLITLSQPWLSKLPSKNLRDVKKAEDQRSAVMPPHQFFSPGAAWFIKLRHLRQGRSGVVDKVEPVGEQLYFLGKAYARKVLTLGPRQYAGNSGIVANELVLLDMARSLHRQHLPTMLAT